LRLPQLSFPGISAPSGVVEKESIDTGFAICETSKCNMKKNMFRMDCRGEKKHNARKKGRGSEK
jgi:hypothetical protein